MKQWPTGEGAGLTIQGVSDLKLLGCSMVDSNFHLFEVDEMSEYQELIPSWHSPTQS